MKAEHLHILADLSAQPTTSARTRLIAIRRLCRAFTRELDAIRAERRALRRQAGKLRPFLPFTRLAVADLERQAVSHRSDAVEDLCQALASLGRILVQDREGMAESLGFDGLCDLLNVNPRHRHEAHRAERCGFLEVIFVEGLEDSAEQRGGGWRDGPLFNACHYAMMEVIRANAAESRAPAAQQPPKLRLVKR
ncbi:hypothetical protein [Azotobacter beijerinckii]|uniref:Uncharacterized protein n=1 Tax=Azotobacter beijerinckii TaxID=170623 RepID=A0A1I4HSH7_9GAMM|nr:hypothetical protein [Azotobacter beijerinckii]SFL45112.1 hypothetical protein SAMN04244574_04347 [Azotobacter beijerinckii]